MIWTLRVECVAGWYLNEECIRVIEIDSTSSLLDLHNAIQEAVNFDKDHLFEFFAGCHFRNRKVVFHDYVSIEDRFDTYENITLEQIYPLSKGLKVYYHFDYGDNWFFEIKKSRKKPKGPEPGIKYPRIVDKIGPNPEQYGHRDEEY